MGLGRTTPLLAACERGHLGIARLLVERGADKARIVHQLWVLGGVDCFGCLAGWIGLVDWVASWLVLLIQEILHHVGCTKPFNR